MLDLRTDDCDLSIPCASTPPSGAEVQILRGDFVAVCSADLLPGREPLRDLADLRQHTLIH